MLTNTQRFPRPVEHVFAGFNFPHTLAALPKGTPASRLGKPSYVGATYLLGDPQGKPTGHGTYLEADTCAGMRWEWADQVEGARIDHQGWYLTTDGSGDTMRGIVVRLTGGRGFIAGWSLGVGMAAQLDTKTTYAEACAAAYAADSMAESCADEERERQEDEEEAERERQRQEDEAEEEEESEPLLRFDGHGLNFADEYGSRLATLSPEFKPSGSRWEQTKAVLSAMADAGILQKRDTANGF